VAYFFGSPCTIPDYDYNSNAKIQFYKNVLPCHCPWTKYG